MCREGSWQLGAIFADITNGRSNRDDITLIKDICPIISAGALCSFGRNMVRPALSAASECIEQLEKHVIGRSCPAGVCAALMKYIIDPSLCTGCGDCIDECPEEAIEGKDGFIHVIDEKLCEKCGKCVGSCPEQAIKTDSGAIRTPKKPVKVGRFNQLRVES
jgi:NADH-quinone oxidoreductase subunit F